MIKLTITLTILIFAIATSSAQDLNKQLFEAVKNNNLHKVKKIIGEGADINTKNNYDYTPLHFACWNENGFEIVKFLIEKGAKVNAKANINRTPIHVACKNKNPFLIIKLLLEKGADVNSKNSDNNTPLHFICLKKDLQTAKFIIKNGAEVNSKNNNNLTPLHFACKMSNNLEIVKLLIENGAVLNAKTNNKMTALHYACETEDNIEIVEFLINKGTNINAKTGKSLTPLHYAADSSIIKLLIKKGADINMKITDKHKYYPNYTLLLLLLKNKKYELAKISIKNGADVNVKITDKQNQYYNYTPLIFALKNKKYELAKIIIEKGADVNIKYDDYHTPLFSAIVNKNYEITKLLIEKGADVNAKTGRYNETPLHIAVKKGNYEIAKLLIEKGADVNTKAGRYNAIPLNFALENKNYEIAKLLIEKGADVNTIAGRNNETPLHIALENKNYEIAKLLIKKEANINAITNSKNTSLHIALKNENNEISKLIIGKGADLSIKNDYGYTALHFACKNKNGFEIAKLLIEKGADVNTGAGRRYYETPLHIALKNKNNEIAKLLIEKGADIKWRLLHLVLKNENDFEITKLLIENGANVNERVSKDDDDYPGYSPLHIAVKKGNNEIAKLLIEKGADINAKISKKDDDYPGYSPLHIAVKKGNNEIAKLLIEKDVNINTQFALGYTILHYSIIDKNNDLLKLLFSKNADLEFRVSIDNSDNSNYTPLQLAAKYNNLYATILLIDNNVNISKLTPEGLTALQIANNYNNTDIYEYIKNPIKNIFYYYIKGDNENFKETLKKDKKLINTKNNAGQTTWHIAIADNNIEIIDFLCKNKIGLNIRDTLGRTPLFYAVLLNNHYTTKLLIKKRANVNISDNNGYTPLYSAQKREQLEIVKLLLKHKAKTEVHLKMSLTLQKGHSQAVNTITFSKNGKYFLSGAEDRKIILWETATGKIIKTFIGHKGQITDIVFCENQQTFISVGGNKFKNFAEIYLWDIHTGNIIREYTGHTGIVNTVALRNNSQTFATGSNDRKIIIWDINTGKKLYTLTDHKGYVNTIIFNKSGNKMYSVGSISFNELFIWETTYYKKTKELDNKISINSISLSNNDEKLIASGENINIFDLKNEKLIYKKIAKNTNTVKFGIDTTNIYVATNTFYFEGYNLQGKQNSKFQHKIKAHKNGINDLIISPGRKNILTASAAGTIKLWDIKNYTELRKYGEGSEKLKKITIYPENDIILTVYDNKIAKIRNINTWKTQKNFRVFNINSVALTPDCSNVYFNKKNHTGSLFKYNLKKDTVYTISGFHNKPISAISINRTKMLTTSKNIPFTDDRNSFFSQINLWNIQKDSVINKCNTEVPENFQLNISENLNYFISTDKNHKIYLWDIKQNKLVNNINIKNISAYNLNPDASKIIVAYGKNKLSLYESKTSKKSSNFIGHKSWIRTVDISSDSKYVLSGSEDYTVKFWDIDGTVIHTFYGHETPVISVQFYDNETKAISVSEDEVIKIWDLQNKKELLGMYPIRENEIAVITPEGLFDASPEAMKKIYFIQGTEVIELSQLKDRYYEPGLLKKIINGEQLRNVQGFNDVKLYPEIELSPVKDGKFDINLKNRGGGIGRVVISINGKEIEKDARGGSINIDAKQLSINKSIKDHPYLLPDTNNIIEVKAYNAEGWLVSRGSKVKYNPGKKKKTKIPELYIVSIGVSDYTGQQIDLKYAAKDAADINNALQTGAKRLFGAKKVHSYLLSSPIATDTAGTNIYYAKPTKEEITKTFIKIKEKASANDILVVYLSGHGINHGGENGDFYYLTADAYTASVDAYNDPAIRKSTTISSLELTELIKLVPALKQVLIIDACASGKVVENLIAQRDISSNTIRALDRMKDRTGMHIITGSAADAVSYEAGQYGQGVLTYSLIDGIRGSALREEKYVDINTLFQYSKEKVPVLAKGIGGIQQPQVFSPYGAQSFDIGILTDEDKAKIKLAKVKPVFIRSMFMDVEEGEDVISLTEKVDDMLNEAAQKGTDSKLIFVDVKKYPEAYKLSGIYTQSSDGIKLNLTIKQKEQKTKLSIIAKNIEELINKIEAEVVKIEE